MPLLREVAGALERPGDCAITLEQSEDGGSTAIEIPGRNGSLLPAAASIFLLAMLALLFVMGASLFMQNKSVLFMAQIAPHGLTPPLRRSESWLILGWLFFLAVGLAMLAITARPMFESETLIIDRDGITHVHRVWKRRRRRKIERSNVRGPQLVRDPLGLTQSALLVKGRNESIVVGENARDAEREWLASVINALLRK
jgi:hypothetical protein